jgi:hypothetical protein
MGWMLLASIAAIISCCSWREPSVMPLIVTFLDMAKAVGTSPAVAWRLLPLIVVIYFVAYIDRTNVSFAAFGMTRDLGLTAYVYGWGAGIFFLGYFLFEVASDRSMKPADSPRRRVPDAWPSRGAACATHPAPVALAAKGQ